jgi:hypothetical protein
MYRSSQSRTSNTEELITFPVQAYQVICSTERERQEVVGVFTTVNISGHTFCDEDVEQKTAINLPLAHVIGQSYDGA